MALAFATTELLTVPIGPDQLKRGAGSSKAEPLTGDGCILMIAGGMVGTIDEDGNPVNSTAGSHVPGAFITVPHLSDERLGVTLQLTLPGPRISAAFTVAAADFIAWSNRLAAIAAMLEHEGE